jgi:hypothetical protein
VFSTREHENVVQRGMSKHWEGEEYPPRDIHCFTDFHLPWIWKSGVSNASCLPEPLDGFQSYALFKSGSEPDEYEYSNAK